MFRSLIKEVSVISISLLLFSVSISGHVDAAQKKLSAAKECRKIESKVIKEVQVPRWYHEGMEYDGNYIWLCNGEKGMVWVIDPSTGAVKTQIEPVAEFSEALTSRGDGTYYATEWDTKKIYHVKIKDGRLIAQKECSFKPAHPAGVVWAGDRLYVITWNRTILGTKFAIVEMDPDMNVVDKISVSSPQEPCQLAWDGKNLWLTSWYDQRVYKIDTKRWEIIGVFCSPVKKTTGIAWDGENFWVTGTYSNLYQIKLQED